MTLKKIIIVGAGFGGITAALKLSNLLGSFKKEYEIIIIDRYHYQLYTPALYEIAAIPSSKTSDLSFKSEILIPIDDIIKNKPIKFICDEFIGLDVKEKKIILEKGRNFEYEFLILALGSETNYFSIPGLREFSFPLKTFANAIKLRDKIEEKLEKKDKLKIVIGGAGTSGVELAAEFVNFVCSLKKADGEKKHKTNLCEVEFILIESSPEILPGLEAWVIKKTKKRLAYLGVKVKTGYFIESATETEINFKDGAKETYDILIWTGGAKGPEILKNYDFPLSEKEALKVDNYLCVKEQENIFAVGDNCTFFNSKTQKPLVWNVPVAEAEGKLAAKNIIKKIKGLPLDEFKPFKKYPFVLAVGKKYAVADLIWLRFFGFSGWIIKQLVELRYFLTILPFPKNIKIWARK